jgi:hypothetical protein
MKNFFHSSIFLSVTGAIVFGIVGAGLAVLPALHLSFAGGRFETQSLAAAPSPAAAASTSANAGTEVELRGTVQSVAPDGGSFVMSLLDGSTRTVVITSQTRFGGDDEAFSSGVQVGMQVRVRGSVQPDGTVNALVVRAEDR